MMVLDQMSSDGFHAEFVELDFPDYDGRGRGEVEALLEKFGYADVLESNLGEEETDLENVQMRWVHESGRLHYYATFPHAIESGRRIQRFVAMALATFGIEHESEILQLRLAANELAGNAIEHGRLLQLEGSLELHLSFGDGRFEGELRDNCEYFNPTLDGGAEPKDRFQLRARRGFGLMMVRRMLDSIAHEFSGDGNRVQFRKVVKR